MDFGTLISFSITVSNVGAFKLAAVSSANIIVNALSGVDLGRSFVYIKNNSGSKIEPYGTPILLFDVSDEYAPSISTTNLRLCKYDLINFKGTPLIPVFSSFLNRITWFKVSKAFLISKINVAAK